MPEFKPAKGAKGICFKPANSKQKRIIGQVAEYYSIRTVLKSYSEELLEESDEVAQRERSEKVSALEIELASASQEIYDSYKLLDECSDSDFVYLGVLAYFIFESAASGNRAPDPADLGKMLIDIYQAMHKF